MIIEKEISTLIMILSGSVENEDLNPKKRKRRPQKTKPKIPKNGNEDP